MRRGRVFVNNVFAGILEELPEGRYCFSYESNYQGPPASLTMPIKKLTYEFDKFPAFFDGLLPEGALLDALLHKYKLDRKDYFGQLMQVGKDLVGAVSVEEII